MQNIDIIIITFMELQFGIKSRKLSFGTKLYKINIATITFMEPRLASKTKIWCKIAFYKHNNYYNLAQNYRK